MEVIDDLSGRLVGRYGRALIECHLLPEGFGEFDGGSASLGPDASPEVVIASHRSGECLHRGKFDGGSASLGPDASPEVVVASRRSGNCRHRYRAETV